jgi:hypothetical protein
MEMTLKIDLDNDAFRPTPCDELARILRQIAIDLERGMTFGVARDHNGNSCGTWGIGGESR